MIDRAIKHRCGRLINTYLISRLAQFITSMTTRILCFFSSSINPAAVVPTKVIKTGTLNCYYERTSAFCENMKIRRFLLGSFFSCFVFSLPFHYTSLPYRQNLRGKRYMLYDSFCHRPPRAILYIRQLVMITGAHDRDLVNCGRFGLAAAADRWRMSRVSTYIFRNRSRPVVTLSNYSRFLCPRNYRY